MTQTDKEQLLLKDLCARLPYGVKVELTWWVMGEGTCINTTLEPDHIEQLLKDKYGDTEIKPYLRPMSSMTEEEISDLQKINSQFNFDKFDNFAYVGAADDGFCSVEEMNNILNYLNSKHLDYRDLITMGLAIEVTKENNPYEK